MILAIALILFAAVTFFFRTKHGTVVVHIDDPNIQVTVDTERFIITDGNTGHEFKVQPGPRKLHIKRGDLKFTTDVFTVERGDKVVLSVKIVEGEIKVVEGKNNVIGRRRVPNYTLAFDGRSSYVDLCGPVLTRHKELTFEAFVECAGTPDSHFTHVVSNATTGGFGFHGILAIRRSRAAVRALEID